MVACPRVSQAMEGMKTARLSSTGSTGRGTPVETSHHRLTPITTTAWSWREEDLLACSMAWHVF